MPARDWTAFDVKATEGMPIHLIGHVGPSGIVHTRCHRGVVDGHEVQHGATVLRTKVTCQDCLTVLAAEIRDWRCGRGLGGPLAPVESSVARDPGRRVG